MPTYNQIVIEGEPRGKFDTVVVSGTPKPGTVLQVSAATEPVNGNFQYEVYNQAADGNNPSGGHAVLIEDNIQGKLDTDAFVTGTLGTVYFPLPGEDIRMLVANVAGTGDTFAIGDKMIVDDGTGKLVATTGSPEQEPFTIMETKSTALTADTLVHCRYNG
jgi:hypothetical protein